MPDSSKNCISKSINDNSLLAKEFECSLLAEITKFGTHGILVALCKLWFLTSFF